MFKKQCLNGLVLCVSLLCLVTNSLASQEVQYSAIPDWVVSHQIPELEGSTYPADYLLFDKQIQVKNDEQFVYSRLVYKLNNNSAVEQLSDIFLGFDPAYETLNIHAVDLIRDGKIINRLVPEDVSVSEESSEYLMHTGRMQAKLLLKDIRKGDTIDYSYSIMGKNPVFGDYFDKAISLQWGVPLSAFHLNVMIEKDRELFYKIHNTKDVLVSQRSDKKWSYYEINIGAQEAVEEQTELPNWFTPYPFIEFSEYKDWTEVANWALDLFDVTLQDDASLQAFIKQLQSMEQAKAIDQAIQFVQEDVRYLGLELGENSHKPHHPDEVFNNRYGDCKDKALLLQTLLTSIGVKSYPALVSTYQENELFKALPSPGVFNHVIVWIDLDGGYWVDATKTLQGTRLKSLYQPNYGAALLIKDGTQKLISAEPSTQNRKISVQENIYSGDYTSSVELELITTYEGGSAESFRYRVEQNSLSQIADDFLDYYRRFYPDIQLVKEIKVEDDQKNNIIVLHEQYMLPGFWTIDGTSSSFEVYNQMIGEYLVNPEQVKRFQPFKQFHPITIEYQTNLFISEWIDLNWPETPQVVENDYFKVTSIYQNDLRKMSMTSLYQSKKDHVDAKDIRNYMDDVDQAENNIYINQSITNVTTANDYKSVEKILQKLNSKRKFQE
ncbi:DUF3857 domain-containing transglutaminase family protein [Marinicellulosiphila megalodicopiae]|uniref:DUF3857 domain-containing transglutaminase family protein n=1 Tax=Marinicellulosiphila megalodicopiae TaxID=2724896 RepID=UPI003BAEB05A